MERRRRLGAALALPFASIAADEALPPTPSCGDKSERTPPQTAGPFYTPDSPRRGSLAEPGSKAERLFLAGLVLSPQCRPVASALLAFRDCDEAGGPPKKGAR